MVRMDSQAVGAGGVSLEVSPGQWAGFFLRITGTTGAGAAPVIGDFGVVTATWQNRPFANLTWAALQVVNELDKGDIEATIGAAGGNPIAHSALIEASRVADGNVFHIRESDNAHVDVSLSGYAAADWAAGSGFVTLYGIPQEGVMLYLPQLLARVPNIAASTNVVENLQNENIAALYIQPLTNLSTIQAFVDGETMLDTDVAALNAFSSMDGRVEAAYNAGVRVVTQRSGQISEALTDSMRLNLGAGAGGAATPELVVLSYDFTPTAYDQSRNYVSQRTTLKLQRKRSNNKSRPVTLINKLAGGK